MKTNKNLLIGAFTLAEILIVLVVIGVITAILLPVAIVLYLKNKVPRFIRQCFLVLSIKFHKFVWLNIKS